jgi:hypothetical protein
MKRDKAIAAMDAIVKKGYSVQLTASPTPLGYIFRDEETGEMTSEPKYQIDVSGFGTDKIDIRALMEIADELDLDVGAGGSLSFREPDRRPEALKTQRPHPR